MLDDTDLGIADIAFASGFSSLRQFNRTMTEVFRATPSQLRARGDAATASSPTADWRCGYRSAHPTIGRKWLRCWMNEPYPASSRSSTARIAAPSVWMGSPGVLEISPGGPDHLVLRAHLPYWEGLIHVVERAAQIVGVDDDSAEGVRLLSSDA